MYTYFVFYFYPSSDNLLSFGNSEITVAHKATCIEDIVNIRKAIEEGSGYTNVVVSNFILLRERL